MKKNRIKEYLENTFLSELMLEIKKAGQMRSSLIDITDKCNLRCEGCYFFSEKMNRHKKVESEEEFLQFVDMEKKRGTNMLTVVGGEPALEIARLKILAKNFKIIVVTNGLIPIPVEGLEKIHIAISFWGDREQDAILRGNINLFETALKNYRNDPRAVFYYTTLAGFNGGIENCVEKMVENGNYITFNFYGDLKEKGGRYSHKHGFVEINERIWMIANKYPERVITSPHINETISRRHLFGKPWGYDVCPSVTYDHPLNAERVKSGKFYPMKFRAYNADLKTTRRCCIGNARDCDTCTDLWAIYGWIVSSMKDHIVSKQAYTDWLCTVFIFYMQTGFIDMNKNTYRLPEIYKHFNRPVLTGSPGNLTNIKSLLNAVN